MGSSPPPQKVATYYAGVHFGLCHSSIDKITEIQVGEKVAWTGSVTAGTLTIDNKELFGGLEREGGVSGSVDIDLGLMSQTPNTYLQNLLGAIPAHRGIVSAVLNQVYMGTNYYLKPWTFICTRIHKTRNGAVQWQDSLAEVGLGSGLMNGVHIIRECLTDLTWGRGLSTNLIDDTSFLAAAQTCFNEGLGFSFLWANEKPIEEFIREVTRHINAALYLDRVDGKYHLFLIRKIATPSSLLLLDESTVASVARFSKSSIGDLISSITIEFLDNTTHKQNTVTVTNSSLYAKQGAPVSETIKYSGVATKTVAQIIAFRELYQKGKPVFSCTIKCTSAGENLHVGEAFRLAWPDYINYEIVLRVLTVTLGTPNKPTVTLECIQDVFDTYTATTASLPETNWIDPITNPIDPPNTLTEETPYYVVARYQGDSFASGVAITETFMIGALAETSSDSFGATLWSTTGTNYLFGSWIDYCFSCTLTASINKIDTILTIANVTNLEILELPEFIQLDNELLEILTATSTTLTVKRGLFDTVPENHSSAVRGYAWLKRAASDNITYLTGETVKAKYLTSTARGTLDIANATEHTKLLTGRMHKPYPPANVKINGNYWPVSELTSASLTVTWATRNRLTQTTTVFTGFYAGNVTEEAGVTYNGTLIRTDTSVILSSFTGSTTGSELMVTTGYVGQVKLTLTCFRAGIETQQPVTHTFNLT